MEIKAHILNHTQVESSSNILMDCNMRNMISLWFKHDDTNELFTRDWGDSSGSDRPIANTGTQVDGDLILTASWYGGFGAFRIQDDGDIIKLYNDFTPNNGYAYWCSIALDRVNKIAYVGTHGTQGLVRYDYSDPDNIVKLEVWTESNSGLVGDEFGHSYVNGLGTAGEYIYYGVDDKSTNFINRFHSGTSVFESIPIQNTAGQYSYRAAMYYSERTDRMYAHSYYDGELDVCVDASTANPKAFSILYDDLPSIDNDGYIHLVEEDKDNPNHLWVGSGYQIFKIDITPCIVDGVEYNTKPVLISSKVLHREVDCGTYTNMRFYHHQVYGAEFINVLGDRGWNRQGGWLDQENENVVSCSRQDGGRNHRSRDYLYYDYQVVPRLVTTANGSKYWIHTGYGWDGYRIRSYSEDIGYILCEQGSITFKPISLDNSKNIERVDIPALDNEFYIPSGCSANIFVSNDGGSSWETYGRTGAHFFTSKGNSFKLKIDFYGSGIASPYLLSKKEMQALLFEESIHINSIPTKTRYRLNGGR